MAAPTAIALSLDGEEYSLHEEDRRVVTVTLTPSGSSLAGEEVVLELRKARRARDVTVFAQTITLDGPGDVEITVPLHEIVDALGISKIRRGTYFFRAEAVSDEDVVATSTDFRISFATLDRFLRDYLHGVSTNSFEVLLVKDQPHAISGVTVVSVSRGNPKTWLPLGYTGPVGLIEHQDKAASGSTAEVVNLATGGLTPDAEIGKWLTHKGYHRRIAANGASSVTLEEELPTAPAPGDDVQIQADTGVRKLRWADGPEVTLEQGRKRYTLRLSSSPMVPAYIEVRVDWARLPLDTRVEELLVDGRPMDDTALRGFLERAISWVEDEQLQIFLEPTRVVTEIPDSSLMVFEESTLLSFEGADWDVVVPPLQHFGSVVFGAPLGFVCPYRQVLKVNELWGQIGTSRTISFPLEWVHPSAGGWVEIMPYASEANISFDGLTILHPRTHSRGIPNFWRFDLTVGLRDLPPILMEAVLKKATIDVLETAAQAQFNAYSSISLGRDGVTQSLSYTASAMFGIYSAAITNHNKWLEANMPRLRAKYRGIPLMVV